MKFVTSLTLRQYTKIFKTRTSVRDANDVTYWRNKDNVPKLLRAVQAINYTAHNVEKHVYFVERCLKQDHLNKPQWLTATGLDVQRQQNL
jgi:hypothetical protein